MVRDGKKGQLPQSDAIEDVAATSDLWNESDQWMVQAFSGVDTVIHAAWYAEPGQYLNSAKNFECLAGTLRLSQAAMRTKLRRFVGIGTCFEYDLSAGDLSVRTTLMPATPDALAKVATFTALSESLPRLGVEFAWRRLFYLHGEGEGEDERRLAPYLRARLEAGEPAELSSGDQIRDYLDITDAARMIAETALGPMQGPVNICSGVPVTIRQIPEQIADHYGRRDLLKFGARPENLTDPPRVVGLRG
ncbi:MAG: NAD-dependent epimerase/dehydratase family protein [Pseudolabrys sp.]